MAQSMNDAVSGVEQITGYALDNPLLLWEAMQAPGSIVFQAGDRQTSSEGIKE